MRLIATDGVTFSASVSVTTVSRVKTAQPIEMPFGMCTRVGLSNHVLDGLRMATRQGQF